MFLVISTLLWGTSAAISAHIISHILGINDVYKYRNIAFVMGCVRGCTGKTLTELILS
jgi:hypothetical protein